MAQENFTVSRYCQDCRFFQVHKQGKEYGTCGAPEAAPSSPDRFIAPEFNAAPYASTMRAFGGCGDDGKWFQAAPQTQVAA